MYYKYDKLFNASQAYLNGCIDFYWKKVQKHVCVT